MRWAPLLVGFLALLLSAPGVLAQSGTLSVKRELFNQLADADIVTVTPVWFNYTAAPRSQETTLVWDFGDGTTANVTRPAGIDTTYTRHSYQEAGTFVAKVRLMEGEAELDSLQATVVVQAPSTFPPLSSVLYWIMPITASAILTLLAVLVLSKGQPVVYNRVFFLLYSVSALKGFTEPFVVSQDPRVPLIVYDLNSIAGYFLIAIFLWFVLVFPRPVFGWLKDGSRGSILLLFALPIVANHLFPIMPLGMFRILFNLYVSVAAMLALGILVYHAWETDSNEERHRIRLLSASFFLLVFSTVVIAGIQVLASGAPTTSEAVRYIAWSYVFGLVVAPALELVGSMLLMYAILRYQLLGIEVFVKRVTKGAMFAIMLGSTFVIVGNTVEEIVQNIFLGDVPLAFIIAGFVSTLSMYPIQKLTERFATKAFPNAGSSQPDYMAQRRMEIYEAQLRYALLDGTLKRKELTMLNALRDSLGIKFDEVRRVAGLFPGIDPRALFPVAAGASVQAAAARPAPRPATPRPAPPPARAPTGSPSPTAPASKPRRPPPRP